MAKEKQEQPQKASRKGTMQFTEPVKGKSDERPGLFSHAFPATVEEVMARTGSRGECTPDTC